ncbi:MAG: hypothetical protein HY986_10350 [Candidatus Melainabacteria bacterium]|nr:hypothetical protein [Candidatus Melainabacteria bacterium]
MRAIRFFSIFIGALGSFLIAVSLSAVLFQSEAEVAEQRAKEADARSLAQAIRGMEEEERREAAARRDGSAAQRPVLEYIIADPKGTP